MAKLVDQLRQMRMDLIQLIERDPEQEVTGQALPLLDAVVSEARQALPAGSTLGSQIVEVISAETVETGDPLRAADALLVVGQLLAVLDARADEGLVEADRRLLGEFRDLLPSAGHTVLFLRDHDLGAMFRWTTLKPLDQFVEQWDNAEHRFHDPEIDRERRHLLDLALAFLNRLSQECFSETGDDWLAVVARDHRDIFRTGGWADDVRRVDELNEMTTGVYNQHQHLLAVARRRLAS